MASATGGSCPRRASRPRSPCISRLKPGAPSLVAELRGPAGPPGHAAAAAVRPILERMLGLTADLAGFYQVAEGDPELQPLALRFRGMRPPCFPTVFEALVNAVLPAAVA